MWSDIESKKDCLNFGEVSHLAIDVLTTEDMLPVSIGVFSNWGAGKSSLLNLIKKKLMMIQKTSLVVCTARVGFVTLRCCVPDCGQQ